jgi:hypothetical protein
MLPGDLLCEKIPDLISAIRPSSDKNQTVSIHLKKEDPTIFAAVVDWLLSDTLNWQMSHQSVESNDERHFVHWCDLHEFAERFHIGKLCIATANRMRLSLRASNWLPSAAEIRTVFYRLPDGHCLQQLVITEILDAFLCLSIEDFKQQVEEWVEITNCHPIFQVQFLTALKMRCQSRGVGPINVQRKRKRAGSDVTIPQVALPGAQQTIDLTQAESSKSG